MNEGNRRMELLGSAPIPKALLAMGLPAMIGMMINAMILICSSAELLS